MSSRAVVAAALAFGTAFLMPVGVLRADSSAQDLLKARHDHYHRLGDAFKTVRDQSQARQPDLAALQRAAKVVNDAAVDQAKWYPAGTGPEAGKTRALAEIWKKPAEFTAAQKLFSDAAPKLYSAASAGDIAAIKARFGAVGKSCKNCHETFRAPEDHD